MAKFLEVIEAIKIGTKFRHPDFYDGQYIDWQEPTKHLMLSKKHLLSEDWEILNAEPIAAIEPSAFVSNDAINKKKVKKKVKP